MLKTIVSRKEKNLQEEILQYLRFLMTTHEDCQKFLKNAAAFFRGAVLMKRTKSASIPVYNSNKSRFPVLTHEEFQEIEKFIELKNPFSVSDLLDKEVFSKEERSRIKESIVWLIDTIKEIIGDKLKPAPRGTDRWLNGGE